jgi:hypothetical protein
LLWQHVAYRADTVERRVGPPYGIVVAVTSNISDADTSSLATKIAHVFAAPAVSR